MSQSKEKMCCSRLNPACKFLEDKATEIKISRSLMKGAPVAAVKSIMYTGGTICTVEGGAIHKKLLVP